MSPAASANRCAIARWTICASSARFNPYLEANGFDVTLRTLFTPAFFRLVYRPGHYLRKAATFAALSVRRLDSLRDVSQFDVVFIYREVFPVGPALVERLLTSGN